MINAQLMIDIALVILPPLILFWVIVSYAGARGVKAGWSTRLLKVDKEGVPELVTEAVNNRLRREGWTSQNGFTPEDVLLSKNQLVDAYVVQWRSDDNSTVLTVAIVIEKAACAPQTPRSYSQCPIIQGPGNSHSVCLMSMSSG